MHSFITGSLLFSLALAAPLARRDVCPSQATGDAPFSQPCSTYESAITCPNGITSKAGGIVLLVHGTASTGSDTWGLGPYVQLLPTAGSGFDVCWVDLPNKSMDDAQLTSEWVAHAIPYLAGQSATGKMSIIGHSQGAGINPPWALQFWPSTQQYVEDFILLAGDFHGTGEGDLACSAVDLLEGGCPASVIQQTQGSHMLEALTDTAWVTTTSIYTIYDNVIQPEIGDNPTSVINGATNIYLQQEDVCGLTHVVDHVGMPVDPAAYALAVDALTNAGGASVARFDSSNCDWLVADTLTEQFDALATALGEDINGINDTLSYPELKAEPLLAAYVCAAGAASSYCVGS